MTPRLSIIDDAFDPALVAKAASSWPDPSWTGWHAVYADANQRKRACDRWDLMPTAARRLLAEMLFVDVSAFGEGLIPDASLYGGGMHDLGNGGKVSLHLDADTHRLNGLSRRVNALLYLTPDWRVDWGGELELWDAKKHRPTVTIAPAAGRLVLFATSSDTWHRVKPVTCPPSVRRKSLACWWYGRPDGAGSRERALFAAPG